MNRTVPENGRLPKAMPATIGKYEVTCELGRGSTSRVYLCHDPYLGKDVALKLYFAHEALTKGRARAHRHVFFNEAHLVGMLHHPSIVPITDAGEDGGRYYVVMEYVRNAQPLSTFTKSPNLLPIHRVADLIFRCAKALDFAHRRGVIHRDIKPSNILLTKTGGISIVDFGIAQTAQSVLKTKRGLMGSPTYMAPEQIRERNPEVTVRSDLFSLGVVMYELLAGRRPFNGADIDELRRRIAWATPVPLHRVRDDVPAALEQIVVRALNKDPRRRYQSGLEFAGDLTGAFRQIDRSVAERTEQQRFKQMRKLQFFEKFTYPQVWELMRASQWCEYGPSERIVTEGEVEDCFLIFVSGKVEVRHGGNLVRTLNRDDCFGETAYLGGVRRTVTLEVVAPTAVIRVNAALMQRASMECQFKFTQQFLYTLLERLGAH